jgi:branched-chain amino acid transport system ATP-binding protein
MHQPLLSLEDCRITFDAVEALSGASLQLAGDEVVGIVGPLGAGKTTLLRVIAGLVTPQRGALHFDGESIVGMSVDARARAGIVHVPAGGGFFPSLTVRENLVLAQSSEGTQEEVDSMTATFPVLGERLQQCAGSLSGGEQRQLAIARGVLARPRLLLLDEPLLGLSPTTVQRVVQLLAELNRRGVAMIIVEERPTDDLRSLAGRLIGLRGGRIVPAEDAERSGEQRASAADALQRVDVEMLGLPLSVRDRRALQTIAQQTGKPAGAIVAELVHQHVEQHVEVWS